MTVICIQCAMRARVTGESWPPTNQPKETVEEHVRRCHADLVAAQIERAELEQMRGGCDRTPMQMRAR